MKKTFAIVLAFLIACFPAMAFGQSGHKAILTWNAPSDADTTTTYNIYRSNATCPTIGIGTGTWSKISSGVVTANYTDSSISVGNWCYYVTATTQGQESGPSNTAGGLARPGAPSLTLTILT